VLRCERAYGNRRAPKFPNRTDIGVLAPVILAPWKTELMTSHVGGNSKLRLLFLQRQPCIRTLKYAIGLRNVFGSKISVSLAHMGHGLTPLYGYGEEYFENVSRKSGGAAKSFVSRAVKETRPDIIHSHNAPDYLTIAATKVAKGIPVIHDTHEVLSVHHSGYFSSDSGRTLSRYAREEKAANERSDARIYATDGIRRYLQHRYHVNKDSDLVFMNYVSRNYVPRSFRRKLSETNGQVHIAYVGSITSLVRESHYYLLGIFKEIARHRLHIHIYPASDLITRSNIAYKKLVAKNPFIHYHRHMDRRRLLTELTQYDYGWAGLNAVKNREHLEIALPNKVIEYVACGLPVLAFQHKTIRSFIESNHVGLVGKDVDDLARQLKDVDHSRLKSDVEKCMPTLIIEQRIGKLVHFYQRLIDRYA
jgi:glycosyltransferase involved in cell wall biosynthesis